MKRLYASPLRVYLCLGALAIAGIFCGLHLPVSLFPNSSRPHIVVWIPYGNMTSDEFLNLYGQRLEDQLRTISTEKVNVEKVDASYQSHEVDYDIYFRWGVPSDAALKEVRTVADAFGSQLPQESRDGLGIWLSRRNSGFFAVSLYSDSRSLDNLYNLIEPILTPKLAKVKDADSPEIDNPSSKEVSIQLDPAAMATLQLVPRQVEDAVLSSLDGRAAGSITIGTDQMTIQMPRQAQTVAQMGQIAIPTPNGKAVHLSDIAHIDVAPKTLNTRLFKTNGLPSLILFAAPKPGGNIKQMSEDILHILQTTLTSLPKDIHYRVLVDPSEFIRSAINNVLHEVGLAALLAVIVLFIFIGSLRNVITAAIEIPLSMVLAFILMRFSGMNLNLISLGGLALSAGMNVDASVVVMENIFRHFELNPGPHDFASRLKILTTAVREVQFAVIASTISSLVVFLPLTFTSALSFAILGDLALAVVFSHGFSALVALILVPTIRLQLMSRGSEQAHARSPIERQLKWLEQQYSHWLAKFLDRPTLKVGVYFGLLTILVVLAVGVLPHLPREVVGKPDTDWMVIALDTEGNNLVRQMELQTDRIERDLLNEYGSHIAYTFTQITSPNEGVIMARLKKKSEMRELWKVWEKRFSNTPVMHFEIEPWNPSELPIPDPPQVLIAVRGGSNTERADTARSLRDLIDGHHLFPRVWSEPNSDRAEAIFLQPHIEQWAALKNRGVKFEPSDLADIVRVATTGRWIAYFPLQSRLTDVVMHFPRNTVTSESDIRAFPIGVGNKIVPLKALATVAMRQAPPTIYREDGREVYFVNGKEAPGEESLATRDVKRAHGLVVSWVKSHLPSNSDRILPSVTFEDAAKDLTEAIHQLSWAVVLSIALIFLTLTLQFGSFMEPLLVLVSVPLGFIGVLASLFLFKSTLSLNSILGVILLNGIAVANSIILVDFIKQLNGQGLPPRVAAVEAAKKRLRPILITSLTTVLGMFPIALGIGEGGRILQPLGIAVAGGLWVSMGLTLFLVPGMQVTYLEWREKRLAIWPPLFEIPRRLSQTLGLTWKMAQRPWNRPADIQNS